jgi:hypothetical protein
MRTWFEVDIVVEYALEQVQLTTVTVTGGAHLYYFIILLSFIYIVIVIIYFQVLVVLLLLLYDIISSFYRGTFFFLLFIIIFISVLFVWIIIRWCSYDLSALINNRVVILILYHLSLYNDTLCILLPLVISENHTSRNRVITA